MKAVGYLRVSTAGQAEEGVSIEVQEAKIRAWADLNGYNDVLILTDAGISGKRADNREALQAALQIVGKADALVVYSLSRLARSTKDTLQIADFLNRKGADLVSISEKIDTSSASGKMVFRLLAVLAEFERDQISERTRAALAHKKSKGERTGTIQYGFRLSGNGKSLEKDAYEQALVGKAKELRASGLSFRKVGAALEAEGFTARNGGGFQPQQVKNLLMVT